MKIIRYIFTALLFFTAIAFPQSERYTKGAENGYAWLAMDDPNLMYNTSKENYLSSILERLRVTGERYPEIASLVAGTRLINCSAKASLINFRLKMWLKE